MDTGINVLLVSSEVAPFAKTGGLADVAGSLPKALALQGNDVRVMMPRYRGIQCQTTLLDFPVEIGGRKETCVVRSGYIEARSAEEKRRVPVYFLDNYQYFDRERYYMFDDEAERFAFFDKACLLACEALGFRPDVAHVNDWQCGLIPLLIRERAEGNDFWKDVATCFTVHNLRYQGRYPREVLQVAGLSQKHFHPEGLEYYGDVNFMKAGIVYADVLNTVSETYAKEIQTPEYGEGLDGVLRRRSKDLYGIVNGINYHEFNPKSDPRTFATYDSRELEKKRENKHSLQRELGLQVTDVPLLGVVSRLVDPKGLDIMLQAMPRILSEGCQFVLLGTGDRFFEDAFSNLAKGHPGKMAAVIGFNGVLAQKIYAGSDMFLMPSRFEPCGLGQLIAMRYGSIPVVRKTGGLADTVGDYDPSTGSGNGFVFEQYSAKSLEDAVKRGLSLYSDSAMWRKMVREAMEMDFSWNRQAALYTELYMEAMGRKGRIERPA